MSRRKRSSFRRSGSTIPPTVPVQAPTALTELEQASVKLALALGGVQAAVNSLRRQGQTRQSERDHA